MLNPVVAPPRVDADNTNDSQARHLPSRNRIDFARRRQGIRDSRVHLPNNGAVVDVDGDNDQDGSIAGEFMFRVYHLPSPEPFAAGRSATAAAKTAGSVLCSRINVVVFLNCFVFLLDLKAHVGS